MTSSRPSRRRSARRKKKELRKLQYKCAQFEPLEPRLLLAVRTWVGAADGNWEDAANWSDGMVPGIDDSAVINTSGITVTVNNGLTVDGIDSQANLVVANGPLTLTADSSFGAALTVQSGESLTLDGADVDLSVAGVVSIDGASLNALNGATLVLPGVTSFAIGSGFSDDTFLRADGAGSQLSLPDVKEITGSSTAFTFGEIQALAGGTVNLASLTTITGASGGSGNVRGVRFQSDGMDSNINLPLLTSFTNSASGPDSRLTALNDGSIAAPLLTNLDGVSIRYDGLGNLPLAQLDSISRGDITLDNAQNVTFPNLTNVDNTVITAKGGAITLPSVTTMTGTSLIAEQGAAISAAALTTYTTTSQPVNRLLSARGNLAKIQLPKLTTINGSTAAFSYATFEALDGGQVDLSSVTTISGPGGGSGNARGIIVQSSGTGSQVDLSSLTSFSNSASGPNSQLNIETGGAITAPLLTELDGISVTAKGTGSLSTSQLVTFTRGSLSLNNSQTAAFPDLTNVDDTIITATGGSISLPAVTAMTGTSLIAEQSAVISAPELATYNATSQRVNRLLSARGNSAKIQLPKLTTINGSTAAFSYATFEALDGGQVDLPNVTTISSPSGGSGNDRGITVQSTGTGSQVDLSRLTTFTNDASSPNSQLIVRDNGSVTAPLLTNLSGSILTFDATATITTDQISSIERGGITLESIENATFPGLTNATRGTITAQGGSVDLSTLDSLTGTSLIALDGAVIDVPNARLYTVAAVNGTSEIRAEGTDSEVLLPAINDILGGPSAFQYVSVQALDGGLVDLSDMTQISNPAGGGGSRRGVYLTSDGADSLLDASSLTSFTNDGGSADSRIVVRNGADLWVSAIELTIDHVDVTLDDGILDGNLRIGEDATLTGNGEVDGNVTNEGSISDIRNLSVIDFTQTAKGSLALTIDDNTLFDQLIVDGVATLGGSLDVDASNYVAVSGETIPVITYDSATGKFADTALQTTQALAVNFNAQAVDIELSNSKTRTWISTESGNWEDPTNWSNNIQPAIGDVVIINTANVTVTINSDVNLESLTSISPINLASGSLRVTEDSPLTGGFSAGAGTVIRAEGDGITLTLGGATTFDRVQIVSTGGATISAPILETTTRGLIQIDGSGTINLPTLTNMDETRILLTDAAQFTLPETVTTYASGTSGNGINEKRTVWSATAGSILDVSSLTSINGTFRGLGGLLQLVVAEGDSTINLSGLQSIEAGGSGANGGGPFEFRTNDTSRIDLSSLVTMTGVNAGILISDNAQTMSFPAVVTMQGTRFTSPSGATHNFPSLTTSTSNQLTIESGATLNMPMLTTLNNTTVNIDGTGQFKANYNNFDLSRFFLTGGATYAIPTTITSYSSSGGAGINEKRTLFSVKDANSNLDLSSVTTISAVFSGLGGLQQLVEATDGGRIDLSGTTSITGGGSGVNGGGPFEVRTSNGGQVDLSSLQLTDGNGAGILLDTRGGGLSLNPNDMEFGNSQLLISDSHPLTFNSLEISDGAVIRGSGVLNGDVANKGGNLDVSTTAGNVQINGDYTQSPTGTLTIRINDPAVDAQDQLVVTGEAKLDGTLATGLESSFAPTVGDKFVVGTFGSRRGSFDTLTGVDAGQGIELVPVLTNTTLTIGAEFATGARITDVNFVASGDGEAAPFFDVTFSEPVQRNSFAATDVTITGPDGTINTLAPARLNGSDNSVFRVRLDPDSTFTSGQYSVIVGPEVLDFVGNPMNQDEDGTNGEVTEDAFTFTFDLNLANLTVSTASVTPNTAEFGDDVDVSWTVENNGVARADSAWIDRIYLTRSGVVDENAVLLGEFASSTTLDVGANYANTQTVTLPINGAFAAGNYSIVVETDADNSIPELSEKNNTAAAAIALTVPALPDLTITALNAPLTADSGQPIAITWTTTNSGTATATGWVERVYATREATVTDSAILLFEQTITNPLAVGADLPASTNVTWPIDLFGDNLRLIVVVDADNRLPEHTGDTNNERSVLIDVALGPIPNLAVSQVERVPDPDNVLNGFLIDDPATVTVNWTVTNSAESINAATDWDDVIVLSPNDIFGDGDDVEVGRFDNPNGLANGQSYQASQTLLLPAKLTGEFHVFVATDADNVVFEDVNTLDNINRAAETLTVLPIPYADLVVTKIDIPGKARSGENIEVRWTVENRGLGATSSPVWEDRVYLSRDAAGTDQVTFADFPHFGPLANASDPTALGSYERTGFIKLPDGENGIFYVRVETATKGGPFEFTLDNNNTSSVEFVDVSLSSTPDFTVTNIDAPTQALDGDVINVTWTVINNGPEPASGVRQDSVVLVSNTDPDAAPVQLGTYIYNGDLGVGESITRTESIRIPTKISDNYDLTIVTNHDGRIFENNSDNNAVANDAPIQVDARPRPNLEITEIILPDRVDPGGTLSIEFVVTNTGTAPTPVSKWKDFAVLSLDSQFTRDDIVFGNFDNGASLMPGESYRTVSEAITIPLRFRNEVFVVIEPDRGNVVDEFPNDDNRFVQSVTVNDAPLADLVVSEVIVPTQVTAGSTVEVRYTLTNLGQGTANTGKFVEQVWLTIDKNRPHPGQGDILLATFNRDNLLDENQGVDRVENVMIPLRVASGMYYITPWVDPYGAVIEDTLAINNNPDDPNELDNNNYKAAIVDVVGQLPDLKVITLDAPATAVGGETVSISWTVENKGTQNATGEFFDRLYLTDNPDPLAKGANSIVLATIQGDPIGVNETYERQVSVELTPSAAGMFFAVVTDDKPPVELDTSLAAIFSGNVFPEEEPIYNRVKEAFEDNNVTLSNAVVTPLLSNLVVTDFEAVGPLRSGEPATFRYTVENQGPTALWTGTRYWTDFLWLGQDPEFTRLRASFLGSLVTPAPQSLESGESYVAEFNTVLPLGLDGNYTFFTHLNAHNDLPCLFFPLDCRKLLTDWYPANSGENDGLLNEFRRWAFDDPNDNLRGDAIAVEFFEPDLRVTNIELPTGIESGQVISVNYNVGNEGTRATRVGSWSDHFFLSRDGSLDENDLLIGSTSNSTVVDAGGDYDRTVRLQLPDGVAGDFFLLSYTDSAVKVDKSGSISSDIGFNLPGLYFDSLSNFVPFDMSDLTRRDLSRGSVQEFQNEGDNILASPVTISLAESPDLQVTSITAPDVVVSGEIFDVTFEITNFGSALPDAQRRFDNFLYLSTDDFLDLNADTFLVDEQWEDGVGQGEVISLTLTVQAPKDVSGDLQLFAVADPVRLNSEIGRVFEFQAERNNDLSRAIRVDQPPPADLVVQSQSIVALPPDIKTGEAIEITYDVENLSVNPAKGRWTDTLFLSTDPIWDIKDRPIGAAMFTGELKQNEKYTRTVNAFLPSVTPGPYYVIVRTDIFNQVYEANDDNNNASASTKPINVTAEFLTIGELLETTLSPGQERLYAINVPANETLQVKLNGSSEFSVHELFLGQDRAPTASEFDAQYEGGLSANLMSTLPSTEAGIVYVLVRGVAEPDVDTPVSLIANFLPFEITDVRTDVGGDGKYVTTNIRGAKFHPDARVEFRRPGIATYEPVLTTVVDATHILATFDFTDAPHGLYDVKVINPNGDETVVPYRFLVERQIAPEVTVGIGGPRTIIAGDIGLYSVALQGVSNVDAPYVYFEFGIPEMGPNDLVYGLDYLDYTSNVRGDEGDIGLALLDADPRVNTFGHSLTSGYAFGQQTFGFDGFNFNVSTYPGLRELNERAFDDLREKIYSARPDLRETGVLDDGPEGLDLIQPGLFDLYVALGVVPDFLTINFIPFQFHVVASATALTREEFVDHASDQAETLRRGILSDEDASGALLALAADRILFRDLFLASLEQAGVLQPENDVPPIGLDARIQSVVALLGTGLLLGPSGADLFSGDLAEFFENIRLQYGHEEDLLAPTDGNVPKSGNPIPVIPDFSQFDLGATAPTHYQAFNVYSPWVSFATRAGLSPDFYIDGFNFEENEPELTNLNLDRFLTGDASASGSASIVTPFSSDSDGFLPADQPLPYTVNFQNPPVANAYVSEVRVVQALDDNLDSRTFRLGDLRIGNKEVDIPSGRGVFQADIDFTETDGYILRVSAGVDLVSNEATWVLQAIDPITGVLIQDNNRGLLPPNNSLGDGFGFVSYTIQARETVVTGDTISAQARVIMSGSAPEETEIAVQTIDALAPTTDLTVTQVGSNVPTFEVAWDAADDQDGSGFKHVTLYVAENGGNFEIWQRQLTDASGNEMFLGEPGTLYEFLALATDLAGNRELPPLGISAQDDGSGANLGQLADVENTPANYGIAPQPSVEPSTNTLFVAATAGVNSEQPPVRQPEYDEVLRPFRGRAFATGIGTSQAEIGPLAIAESPVDQSILISGGAARNELFRVDKDGGEVTTPLATLSYPIYDLAFDSTGRLWATTGGGPLLRLDPVTGAILAEHGDGLTIALAIEPGTDQILVASHQGVEKFNPTTETFERFSRDRDLRVGDLEYDNNGDLWAVTWPDRERVVKFTPQRRVETVVEFATEIDSIAFGMDGSDLEGLLFVSHNKGERTADGTFAKNTSELTMVDLVTLQRVAVAEGGTRGDVVFSTSDGRILVSQSNQVDLLEPVEPPIIISVDPADTTEVATDLGQIILVFSDEMFVGNGDESISVTNLDNYSVVGSATGDVAITSVDFSQATKTATLTIGLLEADNFTLTVSQSIQSFDRLPLSEDFVSTFFIGTVNQPPVANDDTTTTLEDRSLVINVLADDVDPDKDINPTTVMVSRQPTNGTVSVDPLNGQITYTPSGNFSGDDSFDYSFRDLANNVSNEATVSIVIVPVADVPDTLATSARGPQDTAIPVDLSAALTDLDGSESLTIELSNIPDGAILSAGTPLGQGSVELAIADLAGLRITPAPGSSDDLLLFATTKATETGNGDAATNSVLIPIVVDEVDVAPVEIDSFIINDGEKQRSRVDSLAVQFNQDVIIRDLSQSIEINIYSGSSVAVPVDRISYDAATFTLSVDTTGLLAQDNEYQLQLHTDNIAARAAQDVKLLQSDTTPDNDTQSLAFHQMLADFDGNFTVDRVDFDDLAAHYFTVKGEADYALLYDLNEDEVIDRFDYAEWRRRFTLTIDVFCPEFHVELANDTGTNPTDRVTNDAALSGRLADLSGITSFTANFEGGSDVDVLNQWADGEFALDLPTLDQIFGGTLPDGELTLNLSAVDAYGNEGNSAITFNLDRSAPATPGTPDLLASSDSGVSDSDDVTTLTDVAIRSATGSDQVAILLVDSTAQTALDAGVTDQLLSLVPGEYALQTIAEDLAGNRSAASAPLQINIDDGSPLEPTFALTLALDPDQDGRTSSDVADIEGLTEPGARVTLENGGQTTTADGAGKFAFSGIPLQLGNNVVSVTAADAAGNESQSKRNVIRNGSEVAPPEITVGLANDTGTPGDGITSDPTITGTVIDASPITSFVASIDGGPKTDILGSITGNTFTITPTLLETINGGPIEEGTPITITLIATDIFLNESVPTNVTITLDTTVPGLAGTPNLVAESDHGTSDTDNITSDTSPVFTVRAEAGENVRLLVDNVAVATAISIDGVATFTTNLSAGMYALTAALVDEAGNQGPLSSALQVTIETTSPTTPTLRLDPASDTTPPTNDNSTGSATGDLIGETEANAAVALFRGNGAFPIQTTTASGTGEFRFPAVELGPGTNAFTVTATDLAGNASTATATISSTAADLAAPVIQAQLANDTGSSATDGITNDPTITGVVNDVSAITSLTAAIGTMSSVDVTSALSNGSFTLDLATLDTVAGGTLADGTYSLQLQATDAGGLTSTVTPLMFILDRERPSRPATPDLVAANDSGESDTDNITKELSVRIETDGEPNAQLTLFVEGIDVGQTMVSDTVTGFNVNLQDGRNRISSQVVDAAGNASFFSNLLTIQADVTPPTAPVFGLDAPSDTRPFGDNQTNLENIRLLGTADPNTVVRFVGTGAEAFSDADGTFAFKRINLPDVTDYPFAVVAIDVAGNISMGQTNVRRVDFDPNIDLVRPEVTVAVDKSEAFAGDAIQITVMANDNVGVTQTTLMINNQPVNLTPAGVNTFTAVLNSAEFGFFDIEATATDAMGNLGAASTKATYFLNPAISGDVTPPIAAIDGAGVTGSAAMPANLTGTASDDNFLGYTLALSPVDADNFVEIARGDMQVVNDALGVFDPTLLQNGFYEVRLTALDTSGNRATSSRTLQATGLVDVGNFTVGFVDVAVPAAGFPMSASRTYDSRIRFDQGDFGYGWQLGIDGVQIAEAGTLGDGGFVQEVQQVSADLFKVVLRNTKDVTVSVTLPDGQVERFIMGYTAFITNDTSPSALNRTRVFFEPLPGTATTSQLEALADNVVDITPGEYGPVTLTDRTTGELYDPSRYKLTFLDGTEYIIDENLGIQSVGDLLGNRLTFEDDRIAHTDGRELDIERDTEDRIVQITDPAGGELNYEYDFYGDLVAVTDQLGNVTKFTYDANHRLLEVHDPLGRRGSRNEFDDEGRLIARVDASGNRIEFDHDLDGQQEVLEDQNGNVQVVEYDDRGFVTKRTDALGNSTEWDFDNAGNIMSETDELGNTTHYTYDANNNRLSTTDALGHTTQYRYDEFGKVTGVTDPLGNTYQTEFNSLGLPTVITNPLGEETRMDYDANGNLTSYTDGRDQTTTFEYDAFGNTTSVTNTLGHATTFTYDTMGRRLSESTTRTDADGNQVVLTTSTSYDAKGNVTQVADAGGATQTNSYNAVGLIDRVENSSGVSASFGYDARGNRVRMDYSDGTAETFAFDAAGNLLEVQSRFGNDATFVYDALNRVVSTTTDGQANVKAYDAAGNVISEISPNGTTTYEYDAGSRFTPNPNLAAAIGAQYRPTKISTSAGQSTVLEYDANGNVLAATGADGSTGSTDYDALNRPKLTTLPNGESVSLVYEPGGLPDTFTRTSGAQVDRDYDGLGRLTSVMDELGNVTNYSYDELGNTTSLQNALGDTTTYGYDNKGNPTNRTLPLGQEEIREFNAYGNLLRKTDFNGDETSLLHDEYGQVLSKSYPDGTKIEFEYLSLGKISKVTDEHGITSYGYDEEDRINSVTYPDGKNLSYTYADNRQIATLTTENGTTSYTYFDNGLPQTVTDPDGNITQYRFGQQFSAVTFPNGTSTTHQFDSSGNLSAVLHRDSAGDVIQSFTYSRADKGKELSVTELDGRTVTYRFDDSGRLVSEAIAEANGDTQIISFAYDEIGNRISRTDNDGTTTYSYDDNGRLQSETLNGVLTSYVYDNNGNMTRSTTGSSVTEYAYDFEDRLTRVASPDGTVTEHEYDFAGRRSSTTVNGVRTNYLVDFVQGLSQVIEEYDSDGNQQARYEYGMDLIGQDRGGVRSYYHYDGSTSTRGLTDAAGNLTDTYAYEAFGTPVSESGNTENRYRFVGEEVDPSTGLVYLRARYLNPELGQFISMDNFAGVTSDPISQNKYVYAAADPVRNVDPSGNILGFLLGLQLIDDLMTLAIALPTASISGAVTGAALGALASGAEPGATSIGITFAAGVSLGDGTIQGTAGVSAAFDAAKRQWNGSTGTGLQIGFGIDPTTEALKAFGLRMQTFSVGLAVAYSVGIGRDYKVTGLPEDLPPSTATFGSGYTGPFTAIPANAVGLSIADNLSSVGTSVGYELGVSTNPPFLQLGFGVSASISSSQDDARLSDALNQLVVIPPANEVTDDTSFTLLSGVFQYLNGYALIVGLETFGLL